MSSEYRLRTTYWKESTKEIGLTPLTRNALLQHRSKQCQQYLNLDTHSVTTETEAVLPSFHS